MGKKLQFNETVHNWGQAVQYFSGLTSEIIGAEERGWDTKQL